MLQILQELSEQLDSIDRCLDRLKSVESEGESEGYLELIRMLMSDDRALGEHLSLLEKRTQTILPSARSRCDKLRKAIEKCDSLEQRMCLFQVADEFLSF
jgi:prefoldin subunit 5